MRPLCLQRQHERSGCEQAWRRAQVVVMSEGAVTYCGPPERAAAWFTAGLGYEYEPARDGAPSDWLMDLVSVRFAKPADLARRCAHRGRRGGMGLGQRQDQPLARQLPCWLP